MTTKKPDTEKEKRKGPPPVRSPLAEIGMGAAWLVGLSAACQLVAVVFRTNPLATVVVQAVIVDLAIGKAGVRWDPAADDKTAPETRNAALGIGIGAGAALAVTLVVIGVSKALGWATLSVHAPGSSLLLGLVRAVAIGVRDAQLYAGLAVYVVSRARGVPRVAGVVFAALAAGAAMSLQSAATPANVALGIAVIAASAASWSRDGTGWSAVGIAGGWAFFAGVVFRGTLIDVHWKKGALAPGFVADGAPAWIAAALFIAIAVMVIARSRNNRSERKEGAGKEDEIEEETGGDDARDKDAREAGSPSKDEPADAP